jgi:hypothetical protein
MIAVFVGIVLFVLPCEFQQPIKATPAQELGGYGFVFVRHACYKIFAWLLPRLLLLLLLVIELLEAAHENKRH